MADKPSILRRVDDSGVLLLLARLLLGGLFIHMGLQKIEHPAEFLRQVHLYEMLPDTPAIFLNSTAIVLPALEILCGIALILGIWIRGAAALIGAMLLVFTPAIFIRALGIHAEAGTPFFQIEFDCGCGTGVVIIWKKLLENTGLFLVSLIALLSRSRRFCLAAWLGRGKPSLTAQAE